jgi:hypothetical protein
MSGGSSGSRPVNDFSVVVLLVRTAEKTGVGDSQAVDQERRKHPELREGRG